MSATQSTEGSEEKPREKIDAGQFFACELRVGRVVEVEDFPEARKPAYKVSVDFGPAGILRTSAQVTHYEPEFLLGDLVVGVVNLKAKRIAGFPSEFLLLGSYDTDGRAQLLVPAKGAAPGDLVG
ncbi:tRNA-binding protein [Streptomyces sp. NBC_01005]|uniref:tRNA-binding protein n=1 Tax=unclassified Streptomyces TaxID=2593676 RepID=UPI002E2F3D7C|nr:tRNA-binding protein [Streptomyces sp. NBC_01362]WSW09754.1 tRNA-binding protein [Streptomyces sp. NBC_01005]WTC99263.1 tRNA-binding protein [Streptomyces sp. NBC_01650]